GTYRIDATGIKDPIVPYELARHMRASYYFLGTLLGKFHRARVAMPGGCYLGDRPIDQHLKAFTALGARCTLENGMIDIAADMLIGSQIYFDKITVGGTINAMLAACKATGLTIIENAAKEPHIVDLANFLNSMGADIMGAGTDVIKVRGVKHLKGAQYAIIPDQIEAGTYMAAAAATRGRITIRNITPKHLESISSKLMEMGCEIEEYDEAVIIDATKRPLNRVNIKTMPHPGFPTDCQPQFVALLSTVKGTSIVNESVWDNRYQYVSELVRMGAKISVEGRLAIIEGGTLTGAPVKATDLRAGAAMVIAGLVAEGTTTISNIKYIERGYSDVVTKFQSLGADIKKSYIPDPSDVLTTA
ncbi:MAG: UDP-N-acetylglucosamine 1-carboxyvinyltransferase, partial [Ruminococcus sp.]|nr:UDP-N-acetylglucosamine 1-carboxyvinyltransferase [Ruminococcus sp.]